VIHHADPRICRPGSVSNVTGARSRSTQTVSHAAEFSPPAFVREVARNAQHVLAVEVQIPPLSLRNDPTFTRAPWRLGFGAQNAIRQPLLKTGKKL